MERTFLSHCAIFLFSFIFFFDLSFVSSSTRNIPKLFDAWCDEHGRKYSSEEEKSYRLKVFEDNYAFITQHNEMGNSTYTLALNEFADLTHDEFKASRLGLLLSAVSAISFNKTKLQEPFPVRDIPASIDWSLKGAVTEVKDQGHCDAPWAFAVTGAMEGINKIITGDLVSLSEQELIDCDTSYNNGCLTGSVDNAYKFVTENHGQCIYYGGDRTCYNQELAKPVVSIDGYANISANIEEFILQAVARQPVSVGLCGSARGFQFYHWGVFTGPCANFLDHAALIVGYDSILGMDYWIVKNSWGQYWGMKGYILIQRNTGNPEGLCGINMMASYPIKTGPNPPPPPEPIYCNYFTYCLAGQTCCCGEKFLGICILWRCCVFDNAVCCEDMNSCCPPDYPICDTKSYRCLKRDGNATKNSSRKSSSRPSLDDIWIL